MDRDRYAQESTVASISEKLRSSLGPWTYELNDLHLPWGPAIAELCSVLIVRLLKVCTLTLASSAGEVGLTTIKAVGRGRPLATLEIEQLVDILERLDPLLTEQWSKQPRNSACDRNFLSSRERHLLHKLSRLSKGVATGRTGPGQKNQRALQLLSFAEELCRSHLIELARTTEERARS